VDFVSLVSNSDQRLDQNVLRNLLSRSEIMVCGIPKWTQIRSKKSLAVSAIVIFFFQAVRMAIFRKPINDHKYVVIFFLGGKKAQHIIN
jgi:hypothetical protein